MLTEDGAIVDLKCSSQYVSATGIGAEDLSK